MGKPKVFQTGIRYPSSVYTKIVQKKWGTELWFTNTPYFCSKLLIIKPGFQSSLHFHTHKVEEFLCLDGQVTLEVPSGVIEMKPSSRHMLYPGMEHRFSSTDGGIILEISTQHDDADVTRSTESGRIDADNQSRPEESVPVHEQEALSEQVAA